jgi:hypothetical protein
LVGDGYRFLFVAALQGCGLRREAIRIQSGARTQSGWLATGRGLWMFVDAWRGVKLAAAAQLAMPCRGESSVL